MESPFSLIYNPSTYSPALFGYWLVAATFTALAAWMTAVYMASESDSLWKWAAEGLFRAKAKSERKALANAGSEKTQDFLKDQLKKDPALSNDELDEIQEGLGDEAAKELGKTGKTLGD